MSDNMELPYDALGQEVVVGNYYGYTTSSSGWARSVIGKAAKFTKTGKVSLEVIKTQSFLYGEPVNRDWRKPADNVSVRSLLLFPVDKNLLKEENHE